MGPYAGADYNNHSRVDSNTFTMAHGQPYARVDVMPGSTLSPSQGLGHIIPHSGFASAQLKAHGLEGLSMFFFPARWVCCLIA
jgi:hypothetical protein